MKKETFWDRTSINEGLCELFGTVGAPIMVVTVPLFLGMITQIIIRG